MLGCVGHGNVARGLGLAVHAKRGERLRLRVFLGGAVEHIIRTHVHEGDVVVLGHLGQQSRTLGIRLPRDRTAFGGLGLVDGRVGTSVDDRAVQAPIVCLVCLRVGEVELVDVRVLEALQTMRFRVGANRVAQLAVAARHQGALGSHGLGVLEHRVVQIGLGALGLLQRNRPLDVQFRIRKVHERVGLLLLERPVRVHQIRVHRAVLQRLEAVAHAARHVDCAARVQTGRVHLAEALARAQVNPRTEDLAGSDTDVLVPRLRVDATGDALGRVVADVVLHRAEVRQSQTHHLGALPVFLEPATVVAMHRQVEHQKARDVRLLDLQFLLEFKCHDRITVPAACTWLRWRPWLAPTRRGCLCTT